MFSSNNFVSEKKIKKTHDQATQKLWQRHMLDTQTTVEREARVIFFINIRNTDAMYIRGSNP